MSPSILSRERTEVLPNHERAEGLICVWVSRRALVAYSEFVLIAIWRSEQAITAYNESASCLEENIRTFIQRTPPEVYCVIAFRPGRTGCDLHSDSWPDQKEGAD